MFIVEYSLAWFSPEQLQNIIGIAIGIYTHQDLDIIPQDALHCKYFLKLFCMSSQMINAWSGTANLNLNY